MKKDVTGIRTGTSVGTYFNQSEFICKWGIYGTGDGYFKNPSGIAVNASGYVYVVDKNNYRVQVFTPTGQFVTKWGSVGYADGQFSSPTGIAVNASGYVYVADFGNSRVQVFTQTGQFVTKWGYDGTDDGQFNEPNGIAVNASGYVYVSDFYLHRIQVFTQTGQFVTKWGSNGAGDGQFSQPAGIVVNASGYVYVAEQGNSRVQVFTQTGQFVSKWGIYGTGDGYFENPYGIAANASGYVYVADWGNSRVQVFTQTGQFVSKWGLNGSADGEFYLPKGIAINASGSAYISDCNNNRVQCFGFRVEIDLELLTPGEDMTFRVFNMSTPIIQVAAVRYVVGIDFWSITINATLSGVSFPLTVTGQQMAGMPLYELSQGYGGAWDAWNVNWQTLPSGAYVLDVCAGDGFCEAHANRTIYKVNQSATFLPLYEANFSSEEWSGTAGSFPDGSGNVSGDCYVRSDDAGTNFNTGQLFVAHSLDPSEVFIYSLVKWDSLPAPSGRYLADNIAGLGLNLTCSDVAAGVLINVVNCSDFNETALMYAGVGSLSLGPLLTSFYVQVAGSYLQLLPAGTSAVMLSADSTGNVTFYSREAGAYWPSVTLALSKFYQNSTQAYVQTSTAESLALTSPSITLAGDNILHPYDRIIVRYQTTASNPISLDLKHFGTTATSFALSPAGSEEMTETFIYTGDAVTPIEQLEFAGQFEDAQYFRLLSVAILRPQTIMPELTIASGNVVVFGSATAPGAKLGVGGIPQINTTAWGVDSGIANVTASITVDGTVYTFLLGHPSWEGTVDTDYELSRLSADVGAWNQWCAFWNETDAGGNYLRGAGTYEVTITARDEVDTWPLSQASSMVTIIRDLTAPGLAITRGLANGTIYAGQTNVTLNVTDNLNYAFLACTFDSLEGLPDPLDAHWIPTGPMPLVVPAIVTVAVNWSNHGDGNTMISLAVLDMAGWMTIRTFLVIVDNTPPNVTIASPGPLTMLNGLAPAFHVTVNETNLACVQYSFQGGYPDLWYNITWFPANVTGNITSLVGKFNATAWALMLAAAGETDSFTLYFKATDLAGHVATVNVIVRVDAMAPRAILSYPTNGEEASAEAPYFRFSSIEDLHFSYMYYTLSGSPTKFYLPNGTLDGRIDQDAWDLALNASVVITFRLYDSFGNEAIVQAVVIRTDYTGGNVGPGFYNFLYAGLLEWCILGVMAAVTFVALYAYHRGDNARAVKVVKQALVRRRAE